MEAEKTKLLIVTESMGEAKGREERGERVEERGEREIR
jgi:hypothetical protein